MYVVIITVVNVTKHMEKYIFPSTFLEMDIYGYYKF